MRDPGLPGLDLASPCDPRTLGVTRRRDHRPGDHSEVRGRHSGFTRLASPSPSLRRPANPGDLLAGTDPLGRRTLAGATPSTWRSAESFHDRVAGSVPTWGGPAGAATRASTCGFTARMGHSSPRAALAVSYGGPFHELCSPTVIYEPRRGNQAHAARKYMPYDLGLPESERRESNPRSQLGKLNLIHSAEKSELEFSTYPQVRSNSRCPLQTASYRHRPSFCGLFVVCTPPLRSADASGGCPSWCKRFPTQPRRPLAGSPCSVGSQPIGLAAVKLCGLLGVPGGVTGRLGRLAGWPQATTWFHHPPRIAATNPTLRKLTRDYGKRVRETDEAFRLHLDF